MAIHIYEQKNYSVPGSYLIPYTHPHPQTHTPQSHLLHTHSRNPLHTLPHAAHTMRHRLKINGVTSFELKYEEFLNIEHVIVKLCNINIIIHRTQHTPLSVS